jgi:DNA invertase Pin-like site-specific DNA recombinase
MSADHQQCSNKNQSHIIKEYAPRRGFEIVRTYADQGGSGLRLDGRGALQPLISDV